MVQIQRPSTSFSTDRKMKASTPRGSAQRAYTFSSPKSALHSGQYNSNDPEGNRQSYNSSESPSTFARASNLIMFLTIGALCYIQHNNDIALKKFADDTSVFMNDFSILRGAIESTGNELDAVYDSFDHLKKETIGSKAENFDDQYLFYEDGDNLAQDIIEKNDQQIQDIDLLQTTIKKFNRQELVRRFGEAPYHVEFKVIIQGVVTFFTVETAPNELMSHSVFTFMDMVDRKVWDNSVFIHKWDHIVQAAPITPDGQNRRDLSEFGLWFPEYSEEYKHDEYTIGFSGRPGGPEFYINLTDNEESHGPGGQDHSTILHDADPCFAKVVIGKGVIDRMKQVSLNAVSTDAATFTTIESVERVYPREDLLQMAE